MNIHRSNDVNNMIYYVMNPPGQQQSSNENILQQQLPMGGQALMPLPFPGMRLLPGGFLPGQLQPQLLQPGHLPIPIQEQKFLSANAGSNLLYRSLSTTSQVDNNRVISTANVTNTFVQPTVPSSNITSQTLSKTTEIDVAITTNNEENTSGNTIAENISETFGPVEKAVFHQALYNHTKNKVPSLKKCEDCNVIFNSQAQAQMHYKGKKHARVMYLKRKSDNKTNGGLLSTAKNLIQADAAEKYMSEQAEDDLKDITTIVSMPEEENKQVELEEQTEAADQPPPIVPVCRIRYNTAVTSVSIPQSLSEQQNPDQNLIIRVNASKSNRFHPYSTPVLKTKSDDKLEIEKHTQTKSSTESATICDSNNLSGGENKHDGNHEAEATTNELCSDKQTNMEKVSVKAPETNCTNSNVNEDTNSETTMISYLNNSHENSEENSDDKISSGAPSPGSDTKQPVREVVLPDPLPSYIKRVERPTVLKESLHCNVCDIYVNSENQMKQHVNSLRHKNIQQGIPTPPKPARDDKPKTKAEQFKCEVCSVTLNSDIQLSQHLQSQRHKNMLEGKPPKPRWLPYDKTQAGIAQLRAAAQLRMPFKTLANPALLPSHGLTAGLSLANLTAGQTLGTILPQATAQAHLTSFIAPNGSLYEAREVVYLGGGNPGFTTQQTGLPINIAQHGRELAPLITATPTVDWSNAHCHIAQ